MNFKEAIERLKKGENLTELTLKEQKFSDEDIKILATILGSNTTLTALTLKSTLLGANSAMYLAEALKHNKTLKSLILSHNDISTQGACSLAEALKQNKSLTSLDIVGNYIDADGFKSLIGALEHNTTMTTLLLNEDLANLKNYINEYLERNKTISTARAALKRLKTFESIPTVEKQDIQRIEEQSDIVEACIDRLKAVDPSSRPLVLLEFDYAKIIFRMILLAYRDLETALKRYRDLNTIIQRQPAILAIFAEFFFTEPNDQSLERYKLIASSLIRKIHGQPIIYRPELHATKVKTAIARLLLQKDSSPQVTFFSLQQALYEKGLLPQTPLTEEEATLDPEALAQQKVLTHFIEKGYLSEPSTLILSQKVPKTSFFQPEKLSNTQVEKAPTPSAKEAPLAQVKDCMLTGIKQ